MNGRHWLRRLSRRIDHLAVEFEFGSNYARERDAEAVTVSSIDHPKILICFRDPEPSASAVLEELAHVAQERQGHFADLDIEEQNIRREIEANQCLDRLGERLGLPEDDRRRTRERLHAERLRLEKLEAWRR